MICQLEQTFWHLKSTQKTRASLDGNSCWGSGVIKISWIEFRSEQGWSYGYKWHPYLFSTTYIYNTCPLPEQ